MYFKNITKSAWTIALMVIIGGTFWTLNSQVSPSTLWTDKTNSIEVRIVIADNYDKTLAVPSNTTVLQLLEKIDTTNEKLELVTQDYSGLGTLVTEMFSKANGADNNYWQYQINGTMPLLGADQLTVNDGDKVEWYFGNSEL